MPKVRFVVDVAGRRIRAGQVIDVDNSTLKHLLRESGCAALSEVCVPMDLGQHYSERDWPSLVEIQPELGRPFDVVVPDPAKLAAAQAQLDELTTERGRILAGLAETSDKIEGLEERTGIVGLSTEDFTAAKLYQHHRQQWRTKLVAVETELAGVARTVEHLLADQAFYERHAAQIAQEGEQANLEAVVDLVGLRQELLRAACTVAQFPELLERLPEANNPRDGQLAFLWPPAGVRALTALRAGLRTWASATGRGALDFPHLAGEVDVAGLLAHAETLVEAAKAKTAVEETAGALVPA